MSFYGKDIEAPTTDVVRTRYHLATLPDDTPEWIADRSRDRANAEFELWLEAMRAEIREEIEAERALPKATGEVQQGSVADIYATSPYAPILLTALNVNPGEHTSEDFQKGFHAAKAVIHLQGASALDAFVPGENAEWEYGWRSFFPGGEEYEWLSCHSREDAEQQIRDFQEEEDQKFGDDDSEGKLSYSLWRRRVVKPGPWQRVEDENDE